MTLLLTISITSIDKNELNQSSFIMSLVESSKHSSKNNFNLPNVYWNDPKKIVERLKLLVASVLPAITPPAIS